MPSAFDDFMSAGLDDFEAIVGTVPVDFEGEAGAVQVDWNALESRVEMEVHGEIIGVSATIVVKRSRLVNAPKDGQRVSKGGVNYVIAGTLSEDTLTYTLALDSKDVPQP